MSKKYEYESFIDTWQESQSVYEVCDKLDLSYSTVSSLAGRLRKKGIALKKMRNNLLTEDKIKQLKERL